jgi:hypothetical protein
MMAASYYAYENGGDVYIKYDENNSKKQYKEAGRRLCAD